jgi:hypothetical protein
MKVSGSTPTKAASEAKLVLAGIERSSRIDTSNEAVRRNGMQSASIWASVTDSLASAM